MVKVRLHGPAVVVALSVEADASNSNRVTGYMHRLVLRGQHALILDATDVSFLAAQGLRAVLGLGTHCGKAGAAWALATGQSMFSRRQVARR